MRRKWGLVFALAVLGGAALHFLYDVWPNPLTAVLAPVNESVWEHLKLLYWPFLAAAFVLARGADDARGRWCGLLVGLLAAPLVSCLAMSTNSSMVQSSEGISMPASSNILVFRYMTLGVMSRAAAYIVPFTVRASVTTG